MEKRQLVRNGIKTPDGTVLISYHRHDYKTHLDKKTGEVYMVDGGPSYIRRSLNKIAPESLDVYLDDDYEKVREAFHWGAARDGDHEWITLSNLETDHIQSIIDTQRHISIWVRELLDKELQYRKSNGEV